MPRRHLPLILVTSLCFFIFALSLVDLLPSPVQAQKTPTPKQEEQAIVYRGARILTAAGPVLEHGVMVVAKGKIADIGSEAAVTIPAKAVIRDMQGKTIIPGLVDTHSHIGIMGRPSFGGSDVNEMTGPSQPGLRAIDAINPNDPSIRMAVAGGVTTANIMPGSGNVIGGITLYVKLRGAVVDAMRVLSKTVLGGIKFANGENPIGVYGGKSQAPSTRMKLAALQRETLVKAQHYQRQWQAYHKAVADGNKSASPPDRDLAMDPMVEVLERKRTVHFHTHRADDIMTAVRLSREFNFELVIHHGTEAYRVADELAKAGIAVSLTLLDSPGGKPETMGLLEENANILHKAGVKIAINTDDFITESRFILRSGAMAVRGGLPEDVALKALTLTGAQILHIEDRCGSLEKGKDADFVILSGQPFSVYTQVLETHIEGKKVFDRAVHQDWTYQAGGFALAASRFELPTPATPMAPPARAEAPEVPADAPKVEGSPKRIAVYAGRIHTVGKGTINNGVILIEDGKFKQISTIADFTLPPDTPVMSAAIVTPGLIDADTVVGLSGPLNMRKADQDQDENSDPNQADLHVLDSFHPDDSLLQFIREQGVTTIHAVPGRINVIAGQTGIFRTYGRTADQMTIRFPAAILVNLGETPKTTYPGRLPTTRMGTANLVRTAFTQAQNDARKRAGSKDPPAVNLKLEALQLALNKKIPVHFSAHRADDMETALRLAKEFDLKPVLTLATEGYLIGEQLAKEKVPIVVHPTMQRVGSPETVNVQLGNAAALANLSIPIAIGTGYEGYVPKTRILRYEAAMAMVNGLGFDRALRSITLDAAHLLDIDDRYGSIEVGKVADLVLYDGDPFEHSTHVTHTIMDGRVIFNRADYLKLPFERRVLPLVSGGDYGCCLYAW